jgi:hypothetical protein
MKIALGCLLLVISIFAQAETSQWTLANKVQGPWDCSTDRQISFEGNTVKVGAIGQEQPSTMITHLNEGKQCAPLNSSYIFGGVRCFSNVITEFIESSTVMVGRYSCTKEGPFAKLLECRPDSGPDYLLVFNEQEGTLSITEKTGWPSDPLMVCEYIAKP